MLLGKLLDGSLISALLKALAEAYWHGRYTSPEEQARIWATIFTQSQIRMIGVGLALFFIFAVLFFARRAIALKAAYRKNGIKGCSKSELVKGLTLTRFRKLNLKQRCNMSRCYIEELEGEQKAEQKNTRIRIFDHLYVRTKKADIMASPTEQAESISATYASVCLTENLPDFELTPRIDAEAPDVEVRPSPVVKLDGSPDMCDFVLTGAKHDELNALFDNNLRMLCLKYPGLQLECKNQALLINCYNSRVFNARAAQNFVEMVIATALAIEESAGKNLHSDQLKAA